ncbi:MAG: hypothetical protein L0241_23560 [Planctomycetia bacterium]|nr:hypothetical protein [Planctomycetia bacterium]
MSQIYWKLPGTLTILVVAVVLASPLKADPVPCTDLCKLTSVGLQCSPKYPYVYDLPDCTPCFESKGKICQEPGMPGTICDKDTVKNGYTIYWEKGKDGVEACPDACLNKGVLQVEGFPTTQKVKEQKKDITRWICKPK